MVTVERIPVDVRVPAGEVRFTTMQPYVVFPDTPYEPFQWDSAAKDRQLEAIRRTLEVARQSFANQGCNFTLFPEYAVPGIEGATTIDNAVGADEWPAESVVIGGVDGLTKTKYAALCEGLSLQTSTQNAPELIPDDEWVNCCIIWVKESDGTVKKWVQPKIRPAWPERNVGCSDMFCGETVYVFEARYTSNEYPCRFVTLVCFDWVASIAGTTVCDEVLQGLSVELSDPIPLHWAFVIQHNPAPNHVSFLNSSYRFLTDTASFPFVERDNAVIVHANTAATETPARNGTGAFSACIFSPNAQIDCSGCRPTVRMQSHAERAGALQRCYDVVFREMGECIHVFTTRVPKFITPDVTDKTCPLPKAYVYAALPSADMRLPDGPVPAAIKWTNDSLDEIPIPSTTVMNGCPLEAESRSTAEVVVESLRSNNYRVAGELVNVACCSVASGVISRNKSRLKNIDIWDSTEQDALKHVLYSLSAVGIAYPVTLGADTPLHCCIETDSGFVRIVSIRGATHEDCRQHFDSVVNAGSLDPVLLISRDDENLVPVQEEFRKLDELPGEDGFAFHDYNTLITACRNATDKQELKGALDGILPGQRRFI